MKNLSIKTWFSVLAAMILAAVGTGAALAQGGGGGGPFVDRTAIVEIVAEVLGLTPDEVKTALQSGQTIADLAGDQTDAVIAALVVHAEAKIDEAVANGRITEERGELAKANLERQMTALVNGRFPGRLGGNANPGLMLALGREVLAETVADVLGITPEEVITALQNGQSVADIAGDQTDAVIAALVAEATVRLDEAVANGNLDAERAELMKANLEAHITAIVNGDYPGGRPGGQGLLALGREVLAETVADVLGITPEEVIAALQSGQTIADLAGDQTDAVIAALVAEATVRLDEAVANGNLDAERAELMKANLEAHITAIVNGERPGGNGKPGQLLALGREVLAETVADVLGITPEEVIAALQSGQTIADLAGDQTDLVIAALVAEATVRLDEAVANGNLNAERAELVKANLEAHITALVNGERPERPVRPGGQGGNGNGNGGQNGNGGILGGLFENGGPFGLFGPNTTDSTLDQPEGVTQPDTVMGRSVRRGGQR